MNGLPTDPAPALGGRPSPARRAPALDLLAAAGYLVLAALWSWPLPLHLASHIGGSSGDGPRFVWNLWWIGISLFRGASPLATDLLFYPLGADLVLHTMTPLHGVIAYPIVPLVGLTAAHNLIYLAATALAAWATYALARELAGSRSAALVAGFIFGFSAYHSLRGLGHFNLTATYVLPLGLWALYRTLRGRGRLAPLALGAVFALTIHVDYYYYVYLGFMALLAGVFGPDLAAGGRLRFGWLHRIGTLLAAVGLALLVVVAISGEQAAAGGTPWLKSSFKGSVRLFLAGCLLRCLPVLARWATGLGRRAASWRLIARLGLAAGLALVLSAPMLGPILARRDQESGLRPDHYFSTVYSADAAAFVTPPPEHRWLGRAFGEIRADIRGGIEQWSVYQGIVPLALGLAAFLAARRRPWARWLALLAVFSLVLSLGPALHIGGQAIRSGKGPERLKLPYLLIQEIPLIAGARVPSRFAVLAGLALALLAAFGLSRIRRPALRRLASAAAGLAVAFEFSLWPIPLQPAVPSPLVAEAARAADPEAIVLDLPLEVASGLRRLGAENAPAFLRQITHGRPMLGGFVARSDFRPFQYYESMPLTHAVVALQEGSAELPILDEATVAGLRAEADELGIGLAILDRHLLRPPDAERLARFLTEALGFEPLGEEGRLALWANRRPSARLPEQAAIEPVDVWDAHHDLTAYAARSAGGQALLAGTGEYAFRLDPGRRPYRMTVAAACLGAVARPVMARLNGRPAGAFQAAPGGSTSTIALPEGALRAGLNRLGLTPDPFPPGAYPIGTTGSTSVEPIRAFSAFYNTRKPPFIHVGEESVPAPERGLNVVVLDPEGRRVTATCRFLSTAWRRRDAELAGFLEAIPTGSIVVLALWENGECRFSQRSRAALARLGGRLPIDEWRLGAYVLIGVMDGPPGSALEASGPHEAFLEVPDHLVVVRRIEIEPRP